MASKDQDDRIQAIPATHSSSEAGGDSGKDVRLGIVEANVLQELTVGLFRAVSLIVTMFKLSGSVGMALMCWVMGAVISTCGIFVMLMFGSALPRSGGIKNHLERSFSPRVMQTCIQVFYCVFLREWDSLPS
ncbi:High-affinity methionine permease [Colletotrichum tanaceti]|nr:High-affinity methionine permease [Colletotrichum tanaceti]